MRGRRSLLLLVPVAIASLACLLGGQRPHPERFAGPTPLWLHNDTQHALCSVYMHPSSEPRMGEDWLANREMIPAGVMRRFNIVTPREPWDLRVDDCGEHPVRERRAVVLNGAVRVQASTLEVLRP